MGSTTFVVVFAAAAVVGMAATAVSLVDEPEASVVAAVAFGVEAVAASVEVRARRPSR